MILGLSMLLPQNPYYINYVSAAEISEAETVEIKPAETEEVDCLPEEIMPEMLPENREASVGETLPENREASVGEALPESREAASADQTESEEENADRKTGYIDMPWEHNLPASDPAVSLREALDGIVENGDEEDELTPVGVIGTPQNLPSRFPEYNTDDGIIQYLKDTFPATRKQSPYGSCWAHSAVALSEFYMLKHGLSDTKGAVDKSVDYSELQLAYFTYHNAGNSLCGTGGDTVTYHDTISPSKNYLDMGGNTLYTQMGLMHYNGITDESGEAAYSNAGNTLTAGMPPEYASSRDVIHLKNTYMLDIKNRPDLVKQAVVENGIAGISFYAITGETSQAYKNAYNPETHAYYDSEHTKTNHAVAIVGWDDNYPASNFKRDPGRNGAWLIRNSWDTNVHMDYDSYFWISYADRSLAQTSYVFDAASSEEMLPNNYYHDAQIHGYDGAGYYKTANVFTVKGSAGANHEILKAVQLEALTSNAPGMSYTVEIYKNLTDGADPCSGTKQNNATTSGTLPFCGNYTVSLNEPVSLTKGETFSVVVTTANGTLDKEWDETFSQVVMDVSIRPGESFYYKGDKWCDFSSISQNGKAGNVCIRALTDNDTETPLPEQITSLTVKETAGKALKLCWTAVKDTEKYRIYRAQSSDGEYTRIGETSETEYLDDEVTNGAFYYYKVYAVKGGNQDNSSASPVSGAGSRPVRPQAQMDRIGRYTAYAVWSMSGSCDGFEILHKKINDDGTYIFYTYTKDSTVSGIDLKMLNPGKEFEFVVRSYITRSGKKVYSDECSIRYTADSGIGPAVSNVRVEKESDTSANVFWDAALEAYRYRLFCRDEEGGTISSDYLTGTSCSLTSLDPAKTYSIQIAVIYQKWNDNSSDFTNSDIVCSDPVLYSASGDPFVKKQVKLKEDSYITTTGGPLTYGKPLGSLSFTDDAVFVRQDNENIRVKGSLSWDAPDRVLPVGTSTISWIFLPEDSSFYEVCHGTGTVTVEKATPVISSAPRAEDRIYHPQTSLNQVPLLGGQVQAPSGSVFAGEILSGTWNFEEGSRIPQAGSRTCSVVFAPADQVSYNAVRTNVTFTVEKAVPHIAVIPVPTGITYGDSLASSTLTGGEVYYSVSNSDIPVYGTFRWKDNTARPSVSADSRHTLYDIEFVPNDSDNYGNAGSSVTINVNKKALPSNAPRSSLSVDGAVATVSSVALPDLWQWRAEDRNKSLLSGNGVKAVAEYTGPDSGNYEQESVEITIYRILCAHAHTELVGKKDASCIEDGYSGDLKCTECGYVLQAGSVIPKDPEAHVYGAAEELTVGSSILKKVFICTVCGHKEEELSSAEEGEHSQKDTQPVITRDGENYKGTVSGVDVLLVSVNELTGVTEEKTRIWIEGLEESYVYTGSAVRPEMKIYDGLRLLTEKTDYTVTCKNNKNAGEASLTVKFKGNYTSTPEQTIPFRIVQADFGRHVSAEDAAVLIKLSRGEAKEQKPVPHVRWKSTGKELSKTLFEVKYISVSGEAYGGLRDSVAAEGSYTAVITPKGAAAANFTGQALANVSVVRDKGQLLSDAKVVMTPNTYTYTGSPVIPGENSGSGTACKLTLAGQELQEGRDYIVSGVYNNLLPGTARIVFSAVSGNLSGIRGSRSATFRISTGRVLKPEGAADSSFTYRYDKEVPFLKGGAVPQVTVKDGEILLKQGTDYTLSYRNNKKAGENADAKIIVKGKGKYKNSVELPFKVKKQNLSNLTGRAEDKTASAKGVRKPSVVITDLNGKKLASGEFLLEDDYVIRRGTVSGPVVNEPEPGDYVTVTVKAAETSCYEGSISLTYRYISNAMDLGKAKAGALSPVIYTGSPVKLTESSLNGILYFGKASDHTKDLLPGVDFVIDQESYVNNVKKGTAKVTVRGRGGYGGRKVLSFRILQKKGDYEGALIGGRWKRGL